MRLAFAEPGVRGEALAVALTLVGLGTGLAAERFGAPAAVAWAGYGVAYRDTTAQ